MDWVVYSIEDISLEKWLLLNDLHELVTSCEVRTGRQSSQHVQYVGGTAAVQQVVGMCLDDVDSHS